MYLELLGIALLVVSFYRWWKWYLSPLRHIPEPNSLPFIGHSLTFLINKDPMKLHEKWAQEFKSHGMYRIRNVLFGMDSVFLLKPEWIKYVLSQPESFPRYLDLFKGFFPLLGDGILASTGDDHSFQKKILSKAFAKGNILKYIPAFNKHVEVLVRLWKNMTKTHSQGVNIDVKRFTNNLTFDIICDVGFGHQSNSQLDEFSQFVVTFRESVDAFVNAKKVFVQKYFPFIQYLPFGFGTTLKHQSEDVLKQILTQRKNDIINGEMTEMQREDILSIMIETIDEKTGRSFSDALIRDTCFNLMLAGFETVSTAIPIILYHLTQYPEMQEKARKEIKEKFKTTGEVLGQDLDSLEYTTAFIKESLRFFPPVALNGRITKIDCQFGDYLIPKDMLLSYNTSVPNFDEECFERPCEFLPERYLGKSPSGVSLSFGYGPYNCIGKNFALQEIKVTLVRLLQNFEFTIDEKNKKFSRIPVLAVKIDPPMQIRIKRLEE